MTEENEQANSGRLHEIAAGLRKHSEDLLEVFDYLLPKVKRAAHAGWDSMDTSEQGVLGGTGKFFDTATSSLLQQLFSGYRAAIQPPDVPTPDRTETTLEPPTNPARQDSANTPEASTDLTLAQLATALKALLAAAPDDTKEEEAKSAAEKFWDQTVDSVKGATAQVKVDFANLGTSLKAIFKAVADGIAAAIRSKLGDLIKGGVGGIFDGITSMLFPKPLTSEKPMGSASGGRIQPGRLNLVGERGPELLVPDDMATVVNAAATGRVMTGLLAPAQAAPLPAKAPDRAETKVIINNHSGMEARTTRRRGPDGGDIIDVLIGRVAENMARGGEIADAASLRFGLRAQGV
ncbi:MAG: hypothetical protein EP335_17430 [Alphaproteobacteria bacterium]|nr:MAG: hypothetical protein EP335_17430 [Alphaproteobacteria bacterium]